SDQFDSPFEEQVCEALRARGLEVHTQVGCAGYRIDLAICHPEESGRYVLGIECDGAHYHSARSARERDRLRAQVLAGLGWRRHRIWSTDWWQSPEREIQKVQTLLEAATHAGMSPPTRDPVPESTGTSSSSPTLSTTTSTVTAPPPIARRPLP